MFLDLHHEFEVLAAFLALETARITLESAALSASNEAQGITDEEIVEQQLFHPGGPGSSEELVCRMTLTELNALVEAALQSTLVALSPDFIFDAKPGGKGKVDLVFTLKHPELDERLSALGVDQVGLPGYTEVREVKEIAEGFKHRMRLRPTPKWNGATGSLEPVASKVPGGDAERAFDFYQLQLSDVQRYLDAARRFVDALRTRELEIKKARD